MSDQTFNPYTQKETFTGWQTPLPLFSFLNSIYHFQVDAAADQESTRLPFWYGPGSSYGEDALTIPKWFSPAWCNPPYGKGVEGWLEKFRGQRALGNTVVALIPARTESRWWAKGIVPYADIIFLTGRVPFVGGPSLQTDPMTGKAKKSQPDHPSALAIYGPLTGGTTKWWDWRKDVK